MKTAQLQNSRVGLALQGVLGNRVLRHDQIVSVRSTGSVAREHRAVDRNSL